ncbi:TetR/AcrR family transcriptional regulator [Propioniciclava soli]|uniref:TetR family transcriptional regulator C-terminal domain-containing protein n=1 Tax=Propioniciclava soli TaxID=2775081 RepID=A0ABZ3CEC0_9ACTN
MLSPRQTELADVALSILAREGLGAVSFRAVASASGWSLGAVQKAFGSKDELVRAMYIRHRQGAPSLGVGSGPLAERLVAVFMSLMPGDAASRATTLEAAAFTERAAHDARIAGAVAASDAGLRATIAGWVREEQARGRVGEEVDADGVAWTFVALAHGAATQLLYAPRPDAEVRALASAAVSRLLG